MRLTRSNAVDSDGYLSGPNAWNANERGETGGRADAPTRVIGVNRCGSSGLAQFGPVPDTLRGGVTPYGGGWLHAQAVSASRDRSSVRRVFQTLVTDQLRLYEGDRVPVDNSRALVGESGSFTFNAAAVSNGTAFSCAEVAERCGQRRVIVKAVPLALERGRFEERPLRAGTHGIGHGPQPCAAEPAGVDGATIADRTYPSDTTAAAAVTVSPPASSVVLACAYLEESRPGDPAPALRAMGSAVLSTPVPLSLRLVAKRGPNRRGYRLDSTARCRINGIALVCLGGASPLRDQGVRGRFVFERRRGSRWVRVLPRAVRRGDSVRLRYTPGTTRGPRQVFDYAESVSNTVTLK